MKSCRTHRLLLRCIGPADRAEIVAMFQVGSRVERWSPPMESDKTLDQMVDGWLSDDATRHVRLVALRSDAGSGPSLACMVTLTEVTRGIFQNAFIGWRTHPDLQGHGYCTEAIRLALRYAFADDGLRLHRVQAAILPDNLASLRVAEKVGFRNEGLAQRYLYIREQWRDHLIYAITAEDLRDQVSEVDANAGGK